MLVEWLWFAQFNWQSVLQERWSLQFLYTGLATLPVVIAERCSWTLSRSGLSDEHEQQQGLRGVNFTEKTTPAASWSQIKPILLCRLPAGAWPSQVQPGLPAA